MKIACYIPALEGESARLEEWRANADRRYPGVTPDARWFLGVSLGGLFGVWASARTGLFQKVAAISGSF